MTNTEELAKQLRDDAAKLTKAADALDPPTRRKPGPRPGSRRRARKSTSSGDKSGKAQTDGGGAGDPANAGDAFPDAVKA